MKVLHIGSKTSILDSKKNEKKNEVQNFSLALDMANKDQTEQKLKDMLKNIDRIGKKLVTTRSVEDAKMYKKAIQEYLSFIVKNIYVLKKEHSTFNYGIHIRIEIINTKLDELTKQILEDQKQTIQLADSIEEIKGLLVDFYK